MAASCNDLVVEVFFRQVRKSRLRKPAMSAMMSFMIIHDKFDDASTLLNSSQRFFTAHIITDSTE